MQYKHMNNLQFPTVLQDDFNHYTKSLVASHDKNIWIKNYI